MPTIKLPDDHPSRAELAGEVHARPPAQVAAPAVVSCLALIDVASDEAFAHFKSLAAQHGVAVTGDGRAHTIIELPNLRVKWERHGEFVTFTFVKELPGVSVDTLESFPTAFEALPDAWLASLPGRTIAAADIALLPAPPEVTGDIARPWFEQNALAGAHALDGIAWLFTDFVTRGDQGGRTRWLVLDSGMGPAQSARLAQRVAEIEIYRMMALLALPPARQALAEIGPIERRLEDITHMTAELHDALGTADSAVGERRLLDELTRLAADVEHSVAEAAVRFSAGEAYWQIVRSRVSELRERRVGDMRTIGGFLSRRMAPAMSSAAAAARRQEEVSGRIERASTLLRTRVDVTLEEQNQKLLEAMDRRSHVSLRIQQAVEGLSVAAIAYYGANLVELIVAPLDHHFGIGGPWIVAGSIPVIAYAAWRALERVRRDLSPH